MGLTSSRKYMGNPSANGAVFAGHLVNMGRRTQKSWKDGRDSHVTREDEKEGTKGLGRRRCLGTCTLEGSPRRKAVAAPGTLGGSEGSAMAGLRQGGQEEADAGSVPSPAAQA